MGALTNELPKCMAPLAGAPLIHWQIAALREAGIEEIGVVSGYRAEVLADVSTTWRLTAFHNPQWSQTNMVMSLATAERWLAEGDCVVSYADIVYTRETVAALRDASGDLAISYDPEWEHLWSSRSESPWEDAETFRRAADGALLEIGGPVTRDTLREVQGQYMGLLKFTPRAWLQVKDILEELPAPERQQLSMTALLRKLLDRHFTIQTVARTGPWGEADNEKDLQVYETFLKSGVWQVDRKDGLPLLRGGDPPQSLAG